MSGITLDDQGVIVSCPSCGQKNRTAYARLGETGTCGKCHEPIAPPDAPIEVDTEAHFNRLLASSSMPVVVDYWAPWCGPCRRVAPELVKVAASGRGRFVVVKVNTEAQPALADQYHIRSIPTLAVFQGGREVSRFAGARPAAAIEAFLRQTLGF
jgi:thioredoxin 2